MQEVEVKMYDSDSLPSPPPSSESEGEKDPLLDFSRHDDLTYKPAQGSQSLAESVRQATEALEVSGELSVSSARDSVLTCRASRASLPVYRRNQRNHL